MKSKKTNTITLKKLTIARITTSEMIQVQGGSSVSTVNFDNTYIKCNDSDTY
ncbi:hypothetical protein [uncultured Aquimarina sp.]|uniref:hypothetical protein n=1 Tax=uncultured Aquimarina sp. TaxID=575652 RepID=UPI00262B82FA|nr:hypothetical protein [uncultured Aquimarina sp.]